MNASFLRSAFLVATVLGALSSASYADPIDGTGAGIALANAPQSCSGGTNPVPEPGSVALLALGAAALGGTTLRRRK